MFDCLFPTGIATLKFIFSTCFFVRLMPGGAFYGRHSFCRWVPDLTTRFYFFICWMMDGGSFSLHYMAFRSMDHTLPLGFGQHTSHVL